MPMKESWERVDPDFTAREAQEVADDHQRWWNIDSRKHAGWLTELQLKDRYLRALQIGDHELIYLWFTALIHSQFNEAVKTADHRLKWANDSFPLRPY